MRLDKYLNRKYEKTLYFFGADEDGDSKLVEHGIPLTEEIKSNLIKMPVFSLGELGAVRHSSLIKERTKSLLEDEKELYLPFDKWIIHYIDNQNSDSDYFMVVINNHKEGQVKMKRIHFRKDAPQYIFSDYYWLSASTMLDASHKQYRRYPSDKNSFDYLDYTELDLDERFMVNHLMNVTWLLSNKKIEENLKEIKPNPSLVKVAQKKGKLPPISYKVLDLNLYKRKSKKGGYKFPNRQKPSQHTRRGHLRTYQSGKKIYIKPQVINLGSERKIYKDYRIIGEQS